MKIKEERRNVANGVATVEGEPLHPTAESDIAAYIPLGIILSPERPMNGYHSHSQVSNSRRCHTYIIPLVALIYKLNNLR